MSTLPPEQSPFEQSPPTARQLWRSVAVALGLAAVVLVAAVLPVEYGLDPTGLGARMGLLRLHSGGTAAITLSDPLAGNAQLPLKVTEVGQPLPLPNPAVHQGKAAPARSDTLTIELPPGGETEVKTVLKEGQVVLYQWHTDRGVVYVDYHGHSPDWPDPDAFVRYQEAQDGIAAAQGSLVAPFSGEHGWYWVNINDFPVTIRLSVQGYYEELKNYGVHAPP